MRHMKVKNGRKNININSIKRKIKRDKNIIKKRFA